MSPTHRAWCGSSSCIARRTAPHGPGPAGLDASGRGAECTSLASSRSGDGPSGPAAASDHAALHRTLFIAMAALLVVLPIIPVIGYPFFLMKVLCFALFACAFNLMLGYGGLLSFGHAAYFGFAAYVSA